MQISDLARQSGVPAKTIRYYESLGLLPLPARGDNNYRQYAPAALELLRFIASARHLGLALADIGALLAARDQGQVPCEQVLDALDAQLATIDRRIADLLALRNDLQRIRTVGEGLPRDRGESGRCVCYLITAYRDSGVVSIDQREGDDG
jgi:DNA-binding transcriptional MerR regulator